MFIATTQTINYGSSGPDVAAARRHCAPLERGSKGGMITINIWSLWDQAMFSNTLLPHYQPSSPVQIRG
jgi:hypothetical protein